MADSMWMRAVRTIGQRLLAAFWSLLAGLVILYGNGKNDLVTLVLYSNDLNRVFITVALINSVINAALFLYVYVWLDAINNVEDPLNASPWCIPTGAVTIVVAEISYMLGLWPMFGFLSPLIVIVVSYGFIMSFHFVPTLGLLGNPIKRGKSRYVPKSHDE
ncbi:hypothetical protein DUNSADRAFT_188 [Dunaliella salina]|uniref:Transmembrane protein n=1 Tax=Dunaliella salina TaxID=3046 RepID=A0ABQ7FZC6_DUNSA|nr:hypothetical protein DUNSADRAFT_188 [Dunaliella salina]|eukprot:KAF5827707.1 hypothetical protein DUNSADRAFT_188 [Dunaliella salina]